MGNEDLAQTSTWADEVRSDPNYKWLEPFHFTTVPEGTHYDPNYESNKEADVVKGIQKQIEILSHKDSDDKLKVQAIRLLVHFIGDVHQPLHVGNIGDMGGNLCLVKWHGQDSNLHRVWDSEMIDKNQLSYTELAKKLSKVSKQEIKKLQSDDLLTWVYESTQIRKNIYPDEKSKNKQRSDYCKKSLEDNTLNIKNIPSLSYDYSYKFKSIIEQRLQQAGIRLAGILNNTL